MAAPAGEAPGPGGGHDPGTRRGRRGNIRPPPRLFHILTILATQSEQELTALEL